MPAADLKRRVIEVFLEVIRYPKKEPAMTHQEESAVVEAVMAILIELGPAAMSNQGGVPLALATCLCPECRRVRQPVVRMRSKVPPQACEVASHSQARRTHNDPSRTTLSSGGNV